MPAEAELVSAPPRYEPGSPIVEGIYAWAPLGTGCLCESWMAWSTVHGRPVTLKIAQPADVEGARRVLRREASHLRAVAHPAFQRLLGGDLEGAEPFLVLEYVEGYTLSTILSQEGTLKLVDALNVATELVAALGYLHRLGVAHMDVNPANVILRDGRVVLMDLGLVFPLGTPIPPGSPRGTQGYIAPEQWDSAPCSPAMDLFSVGCVLYELLSGTAVYDFDDRPLLPPARLTKPRLRRARRRELDRLIDGLIALDPDRRACHTDDALRLLSSTRGSAARLWPEYVDNLLSAPTVAQPNWMSLVR